MSSKILVSIKLGVSSSIVGGKRSGVWTVQPPHLHPLSPAKPGERANEVVSHWRMASSCFAHDHATGVSFMQHPTPHRDSKPTRSKTSRFKTKRVQKQ